jgi:pimeloyl-ACP methyl ester carboxylesterase
VSSICFYLTVPVLLLLISERRNMKRNPFTPYSLGMLLRSIAIVLALTAIAVVSTPALAREASTATKPNIVLVHGAWADGSGWADVIKRLQADGYTVYAPPNPLRGISADSAYVASFLNTLSGAIILVGHSYGGAVITNAATGNSNVKALVYIDGFVPKQGETGLELISMPPPPGEDKSCVGGDPTTTFNFVPYPGAPPGDVDLYIKPELFQPCFANELSTKKAAILAASQRPIVFSALTEPSGPPAWETIPSWYLIGTLDNVIPPYLQRFMAERANAEIVEVKAMHPAMISHPGDVVDLIEKAAKTVAGGN